MDNVKNRTYGFTLVELLLYVGVVSMMILGISSFSSIIFESKIKHQSISEVESAGLQIMLAIGQSIRNAESINLPATSTTASSLSLSFASSTINPTLFSLSSGTIKMSEGTPSRTADLHSSRVIASELYFSNLSRGATRGTIRFQFTLSYAHMSERNEYDYEKTFLGSATLR